MKLSEGCMRHLKFCPRTLVALTWCRHQLLLFSIPPKVAPSGWCTHWLRQVRNFETVLWFNDSFLTCILDDYVLLACHSNDAMGSVENYLIGFGKNCFSSLNLQKSLPNNDDKQTGTLFWSNPKLNFDMPFILKLLVYYAIEVLAIEFDPSYFSSRKWIRNLRQSVFQC